jgi:hypothetical protein
MNRVPRDEYTDASVRFFKSMQTKAGNWDVFESWRPPMASGLYMTAAMAIYTLKSSGPVAEKADTNRALARAAAWLQSAKPAAGRLRDRTGALCAERWRVNASERSRLCQGSQVSPEHPDSGRFLARQVAINLAAAILRQRLPVRARSVDFGDGNCGANMAFSMATDLKQNAPTKRIFSGGRPFVGRSMPGRLERVSFRVPGRLRR